MLYLLTGFTDLQVHSSITWPRWVCLVRLEHTLGWVAACRAPLALAGISSIQTRTFPGREPAERAWVVKSVKKIAWWCTGGAEMSHPFSFLFTGDVLSWVLLFLCFPDAQLLIAGPVSSTSPPDLTYSRISAWGCITIRPHLRLSYKGHQGGAATSRTETGGSDQLPVNWFGPLWIRTQLVLKVLNHIEPERSKGNHETNQFTLWALLS